MAQTHALYVKRASSQDASIADASAANLDTTGAFTIEAWVRLAVAPTTGQYFTIVSKGGISVATSDTTLQYALWYDNDGGLGLGTLIRSTGANTALNDTTTLTVNTWYHIAFSYEPSTTLRLWINGRNVATNTTSIPASTVNTARPFGVGSDQASTPANYWDGQLKDVRFFNDVRTGSEIASDAFTESVSDANLQGEWNFNNAYTDTSGNSYTLTANNSPVFSVDVPWKGESGVESTAYCLDLEAGSSQYAGVADHADFDLSTFTMGAWIELETIPSEFHIAGKWRTTDNNRSYRFMIDTTGSQFRLDTSSAGTAESQATAAIGHTLKTGEWYHVAVTKTGTTTKFYLNGIEYTAGGTTENTVFNGAADFRIGANGNATPGGLLDGRIHTVRLFSDVRTQSEILSDALADEVTDANLNAEWKLDNAYTDSSGNGHTLTASGTPVFKKWRNHIAGGLVSHYELEESSGTRVDSHGSNDLADNNTVTSATGKQGTAAQFVRANSEYLSIADTADLDLINKFSISTWFYLDTATTGAAYVIASKKGAGSTRQYVLKVSSAGTIALQASSTGVSFDRDTNVSWTETTGAWHHLVLTWDDGTVTYYLNGVQLGAPQAAGGTSLADSTGDFNMGREVTATDHFNGRIDEFMVYKYRVLDYGDVLNLYNGGNGIAYVGGTAYTSDLTESVNASDDLLLQPEKNFTESITATAGIILDTGKVLAESITATATAATNLILNTALTESIVASATATAKITQKIITESITATATILRDLTRTLTESITASDTITNAFTFYKNLTESITASVTSTAKITGKILSENVVVSATLGIVSTFSKTLTESITATANLAKSTTKVLSDSITASATLAKVLTATRSFTESINVRARLYGLLNGVNMLWNNKYVDKAGTWINKYLDNK